MREVLMNSIVETYSRLANVYDDDRNLYSCWGRVTQKALAFISLDLKDIYELVVDVGCGPGRELLHLVSKSKSKVQFIGLEPAANMRTIAIAKAQKHPNVRILDGSFEKMPLESESVDYLYSILAFHWTTDLDQAVNEISRVLKPTGEMDLVFIGRYNGREFIEKTTPIFRKYMGLASLVESSQLRKQLTKNAAMQLFSRKFSEPRLTMEESYETYYDTLEGHWNWWVRIEGHFVNVPPHKKKQCDEEVKQAIASLTTEKGIPYTVHLLHVKLEG
jgi:ubiquinone/menaquinone biosynthesis C-methylase UbiE